MSFTSRGVRHILDIPDEILIEILRHLNARERAVLGNSSERFNRLLFKDKKLLRDLDFSYEGRLTSAWDIQSYFINEGTNRHILKVNLRNVKLAEPGRILNDYVGTALSLVDINIHGVELEGLQQFVSFLNPLIFVRRLSIDWPINGIDDVANYDEIHQALHQPLNRLTYLSVRTNDGSYLSESLDMISMCQQLRELHIFHDNGEDDWCSWRDIEAFKNLEMLEFCGDLASYAKKDFLQLVPEPEIWIGFGLSGPLDEQCFHLEKHVEVCEEIEESGCIIDLPDSLEWTLGNRLRFDRLLGAVIKIIQEDIPKKFCVAELEDEEPCALKIDDAKLLLKNPRHQIKYLYLGDSIGTECRIHRFALAAPNLTELYLSDISKIKRVSTSKQPDFGEQNDLMNRSPLDSSFKIIVENTPRVKDLTLNGRPGQLEADEAWDLSVLCLIQGWKDLKSLRLLSIPICDGEFLIEIGKQCDSLEKLELCDLGPSSACCYMKQLSLMLTHCQNLTDFSMHAGNIGPVSEVFVSLAKNLKLRKVRLRGLGDMNNTDNENLISSIQQLLRSCADLDTFVCIIDGKSQDFPSDFFDQLTSSLRRLRDELNRPSLQFQVGHKSYSKTATKMETVCEDSLAPTFPYTWDEFSYM